MAKYTIEKDSTSIHVHGYDQYFSNEDISDLWKKHKILYHGGVMAVWIQTRDDKNPLVHLMGEDDGHIFWEKGKDICFDSAWLDDYINTLSKLKELLKTKK